MSSHETEFSPSERAVVTELVKQADRFRSAVMLGQLMMHLYKEFKRKPFAIMEEVLREQHSNTYLIARHISDFPPEFTISLPGEDEKQYTVWICVNVKGEADALLAQIGSTHEENKQLLKECGFLIPKSGTSLKSPRSDLH